MDPESPSSSLSLDSISSFESSYTPQSEAPSDISPGISPGVSPSNQNLSQSPQSPLFENQNNDNDNDDEKEKNKFTWELLNKKWQNVLLSNSFYVKDCAGDGNCQFRSLEEALKKSDKKNSHKQLRKLLSEHILNLSDDDFNNILNSYIEEQNNGEFYGDWDPSRIKNKKQFANEIKKSGFNFEGDHITLGLLSQILKIDFLIFNEREHSITPVENDNPEIIILNNIKSGNSGHYRTVGIKTVGVKNSPIETIFKRGFLPESLSNILNKNIFFKSHIEKLYTILDNFTCNEVILKLKEIMSNLSESDKKLICKILATFVKAHDTKKVGPSGPKSPKKKEPRAEKQQEQEEKEDVPLKTRTSPKKSRTSTKRSTKKSRSSTKKSRSSTKKSRSSTKKSRSSTKKSRSSTKKSRSSTKKSRSSTKKSRSSTKKSRSLTKKSTKTSTKKSSTKSRSAKKRSVKKSTKARSVKKSTKARSVKKSTKARSVKKSTKARSSTKTRSVKKSTKTRSVKKSTKARSKTRSVKKSTKARSKTRSVKKSTKAISKTRSVKKSKKDKPKRSPKKRISKPKKI
jgi:hypothetical protein